MTVELRRIVSQAPVEIFGTSGAPVFILHDRNSTALFNGAVSVGLVSTTVRAANASRMMLVLVNDSNKEIYIAEAATAVLNSGARLNRRGGVAYISNYTGIVTAISDTAGSNLTIIELDQPPPPP